MLVTDRWAWPISADRMLPASGRLLAKDDEIRKETLRLHDGSTLIV